MGNIFGTKSTGSMEQRGSNCDSSNHNCTLDNNGTPSEMIDLTPLLKFFEKFMTDKPTVEIPSDEFIAMRDFVKDAKDGKTKRGGSMQNDQHSDRKNSNSLTVQLLNTNSTGAAKQFSVKMKDYLEREFTGIEIKEIKRSDVLEQQNVVIVICNKIESDNIQQSVDKSLENIEADWYQQLILIILHVTRKPPCTPTRTSLQSCDHPEKYKSVGKMLDMAFQAEKDIYDAEINKIAFREITKIISEYTSTQTRSEDNLEIKMIGANDESNPLGSKTDIPKPDVYIMNYSDTNASTNFVQKFKEEMKTQDIIFTTMRDFDDHELERAAFLILVCSITSRLETDVDNCLKALSCKQYHKTILVILYVENNTDEHCDSRKILVKSFPEKYKNIFQIIDMAFTNDNGIYQCEMNAKAFTLFWKIFKDSV